MEEFAKGIKKKTVLILDQASIHQNRLIQQRKMEWQKKDLFLQLLPPYCPELNKDEVLWKHLKYYRMDLKPYQSLEDLEKYLVEVLQNMGKKYYESCFNPQKPLAQERAGNQRWFLSGCSWLLRKLSAQCFHRYCS